VELPIGDLGASRRHAVVEHDPVMSCWVIRDLESTNGTRVNGTRLPPDPQAGHALTEGDKVFIGGTVIKFTLTDELEASFHEKLEAMVARDELTGNLTRRKFDAALAQAVEGARQEGTPVAVLMMDMDGLKALNDKHGHHCGSHAITVVGKMIAERFAGGSHACRFGGDEFIAFAVGMDRAEGMVLAETLRAEVAAAPMELDGIVLQPTLSIGVAAFPEDGDTPDAVAKVADLALYRAKAAGRNRVSS
jgi:diguanylate cyclase (GGDEF)-like protein